MASSTDTTQSTATEQPRSSKLLSLPPELRNIIWSFAFTIEPEYDQDDFNLLQTTGPSAAVLCTCYQVYLEAIELYIEARDHFWSTSKFYILDGYDNEVETIEDLYKLDDRAMSMISHLIIEGKADTFDYEDGIWTGVRRVRAPERCLILCGRYGAVLVSRKDVAGSEYAKEDWDRPKTLTGEDLVDVVLVYRESMTRYGNY